MYRGVALPGIPNYFTLLGNNMGLNHSECLDCRSLGRSLGSSLGLHLHTYMCQE
jgi:hypothetical protein